MMKPLESTTAREIDLMARGANNAPATDVDMLHFCAGQS
jgi:hypothetical protein